MLRRYMAYLWKTAYLLNKKNILDLAVEAGRSTPSTSRSFVDLGCDNGEWTAEVAKTFGATEIHGVEVVRERAQEALGRGIKIHACDMNLGFSSIADQSMDLVHANMVIEHIEKLDVFASEIYRILKPGGHAIVATENGSSWHNIIAAIMGWQLFSSTNITTKANVGNPMALYRHEAMDAPPSMMHKTIFNYLGYIEFFMAHGFKVNKVLGAGYYPLPSWIGAWDVRHSHFIIAYIQKP